MATQRGVDVLLKIGDGGSPTESFSNVGGARTVSFSETLQPVDTTSASSTNQERELLGGAGIRSGTATFSGVFQDDAQDTSIETDFRARTQRNFQFVYPDFGTYEGPFMITNFTRGGTHDGEATFDLTLESAGVVAFTAA